MKTVSLSIAIGLLIFTELSVVCVASAADVETLRQRTDRLVQPYLDNDMIVGMTIGVLFDGKREVFGYGRMSRDDRRVPDGDTIYEIGSATKVITGILLADAVVQGQVKLDQPAGELLPANVKMPAKGDRAITLQDLSTHVSGLPRLPDNMKPGDPNNPYADYLDADLYAFLSNYQLVQVPGKQIEYSNLGQGLLGHLLSRQAKSTYEDLVRNRIAVPLKMSSTKITIDKESQSRLAPGHTGDGRPAANWDLPVLAGAGGVRSTVNDLLLFAAANLAPPKNKLGQAIEMAWTVHQKPINKSDSPLGLGWHVVPDGTHWHNGQTGGYHSMILINRATKTGVILITNTATEEVDELATDILRMISGAKVVPRKIEKPVNVPAEALQKLVGRYELAPGAVFTVEVVDGKLMIGLTGQPALQVFARSETIWFSKLVDATITFNLDKNGKCESLVLFQNGIKQTAKRKQGPEPALPKDEKPIAVPVEALQKFVGRYELAPGVLFTVEAKDDKLMIGLTGQPSFQVFARSETVWFYKVVAATITFNVDQNGKCDSLVLFQNGIKQLAKRKK
ncbi:MAG: serine hydrolase [Planctomycetaceae bacterium]|nr:serine hydrolase [Planctomycetaceae bacterium]